MSFEHSAACVASGRSTISARRPPQCRGNLICTRAIPVMHVETGRAYMLPYPDIYPDIPYIYGSVDFHFHPA